MKADYRCMVGHAAQNKFIESAGLGIVGAFEPIVYTITWKDGEVVDQVRAEKLCGVLKEGINNTGELQCSSVELVRIY